MIYLLMYQSQECYFDLGLENSIDYNDCVIKMNIDTIYFPMSFDMTFI